MDRDNFDKAQELPGIKVFQYNCAIFFMNREHFKHQIFKKTLNLTTEELLEAVNSKSKLVIQIHTIIIDCSCISYLDSSGVELVNEVVLALKDLNIHCYLVACPTHVLLILERTNMLATLNSESSGLFPSIQDAVAHCTSPGFGANNIGS